MTITLKQGDCLELMKELPDESVDAVITDPPYGKKWARGKNGVGQLKELNEKIENLKWDIKPTAEYFNHILRIGKTIIIFGGNYFTDSLPQSNGWIVWDKKGNIKKSDWDVFADCELAWTNTNRVVKKYVCRIQGYITDMKEERVHPTQKPVKLMRQIISDFTKEGDTILDPFMGSGTTGVACVQLNRNFIGYEISPDYFKIAEKRIREAETQRKLNDFKG